MKTELQQSLQAFAPSVSVRTIWEHDTNAGFRDLTGPGEAFENEDPDKWTAWRAEVRVTAIVAGEEITGSDFLGCTLAKAGDNPEITNPTISGYELGMTAEALRRLLDAVPADSPLRSEIAAAISECERLSHRR